MIPEILPERQRRSVRISKSVGTEKDKVPEPIPDKLKQVVKVQVTRCGEPSPSTSRASTEESEVEEIDVNQELDAGTHLKIVTEDEIALLSFQSKKLH